MDEALLSQLRRRASNYAELSDWLSARENASTKLTFLASGRNVMVDVEVEDSHDIYLNIGLGIFIKASHKEARTVAENEAKRLSDDADKFEQDCTQRAACDIAVAKSKDWSLKNQ